MINFDSGPAQVLGASVMVGSCLLYSTRMNNAKITKDGDVVVSSVGILVGGILVFQGWRLDPLLLFGQILTTGVAACFVLESLKLRAVIADQEETLDGLFENDYLIRRKMLDYVPSNDTGSIVEEYTNHIPSFSTNSIIEDSYLGSEYRQSENINKNYLSTSQREVWKLKKENLPESGEALKHNLPYSPIKDNRSFYKVWHEQAESRLGETYDDIKYLSENQKMSYLEKLSQHEQTHGQLDDWEF